MTCNPYFVRMCRGILLPVIAICLCAPTAWQGTRLLAATAVWNSGWSGGSGLGGVPGLGDDIEIQSGDLTWNSTLWATTVNSWTQGAGYTNTVTFDTTYVSSPFMITTNALVDGGTWNHLNNTATQTNRLHIEVGNNLTLGSSASINVSGLGFGTNDGLTTGGPGSTITSRSGGAYGGEGGTGLSGGDTAMGATYGSYTAPIDLGSTGGRSGGGRTTPGGGAVLLNVGGLLTVDGVISANGLNSSDLGLGFSSGGSGGSIYLQAATFDGTGMLRANGGNDASTSGAGGGGRIAVDLSSGASFGSVTMQAFGSAAVTSNNPGAAGTIYLETGADAAGLGRLIIDNNNIAQTNLLSQPVTAIPVGQTYSPGVLETRNHGVLGLGSGTTLNLKNTVVSDADSNADGIRWRQGTFTLVDGAINISNWSLVADGANTLAGNVVVGTNGVITHTANNPLYAMLLNLNGNLDVQTGGSINANGKGYGPGLGVGTAGGGAERGGGGYGGQGGNSTIRPSAPLRFGAQSE